MGIVFMDRCPVCGGPRDQIFCEARHGKPYAALSLAQERLVLERARELIPWYAITRRRSWWRRLLARLWGA